MPASPADLEIAPIHPLFGAEITGVDITRDVPDSVFEVIWQAFNKHQVIIFRDQKFEDPTQIAFSKRFGNLETTDPHAANNYTPVQVAVMTNIDADGNFIPLDDKRMVIRLRNEIWHTDSSFKPVAAMASLLSGRRVPPVGGDTEFASQRAAYAALPEARRRKLDGLVAIHQVETSMKKIDADMFKRDAKRPLAPVQHPLVRINPVTGERSLFVSSHACGIVGMPEDEAQALLAELTAHCTSPEFVYIHKWRQYDLVIWDNRCTLHRGGTYDKTKHVRVLHRTTVAGQPDEPRVALAS